MEHEALESNNQSETSSSIFNGDEDSVTRFPCSALFNSTTEPSSTFTLTSPSDAMPKSCNYSSTLLCHLRMPAFVFAR